MDRTEIDPRAFLLYRWLVELELDTGSGRGRGRPRGKLQFPDEELTLPSTLQKYPYTYYVILLAWRVIASFLSVPPNCPYNTFQVAIKWCTACDDPFCGPCWTTIHSRGKRSFHSHCTISPGGRISTKAIAADGNTVGPFTPGESLIAETAGGGGGYEWAAAEQGYGATAAAAPLAEVQTAGSVSNAIDAVKTQSIRRCSIAWKTGARPVSKQVFAATEVHSKECRLCAQ